MLFVSARAPSVLCSAEWRENFPELSTQLRNFLATSVPGTTAEPEIVFVVELNVQYARIGHLSKVVLLCKWGQHVTRVAANCCYLWLPIAQLAQLAMQLAVGAKSHGGVLMLIFAYIMLLLSYCTFKTTNTNFPKQSVKSYMLNKTHKCFFSTTAEHGEMSWLSCWAVGDLAAPSCSITLWNI